MDDINEILTDEDFKTGFESVIVPAGKYEAKLLRGNPRIKVSESGNRYLNLRLVATATDAGEPVRSKVIYHTVPFEGTNKEGNPNRRMFAGFMAALGLEQDAVRDIYTALVETAPTAAEITAGDGKTEVALTLKGDNFSLDNRTVMASIKEQTYTNRAGEQVVTNRIGSVWAVKAE